MADAFDAYHEFLTAMDADLRADYEEAVNAVAEYHNDGFVQMTEGSEEEARKWLSGRKKAMVSTLPVPHIATMLTFS
jgi:hypothetical protein